MKPVTALIALLLPLGTGQAHEGCFVDTKLAVVLVAYQARMATEAIALESRYWAAARQVHASAGAQPLLEAAEAASRDHRQRHCEAVAAPHAGAPLYGALRWECEAAFAKRAARQVWFDFLRQAPDAPLPEPTGG